jgi:hypothetical protein
MKDDERIQAVTDRLAGNKLTTNPRDPRLIRGPDSGPRPQNDCYLILSEEERAKGFVRPVRHQYVHRGRRVCGKPKMIKEYSDMPHVCVLPPNHNGECSVWQAVATGKLVDRLKRTGYLGGCDAITRMSNAIAETYAREPTFYGYTYCTLCSEHLPVDEFEWDGSDAKVGS